jgi:1-acyl-sn-glycerol-3-phosphate acyltransferase
MQRQTPESRRSDSPAAGAGGARGYLKSDSIAALHKSKMTGTVLAAMARLLSGSSVRWIDCQPDTCQRVYFANHTSHLDSIVVWSALPHTIRALVRPVAAKDYWEKGFVRRYLARTFNALLIDRTDIKVHQSPVDLMLREIGDRYSLIVFPEGSRGADAEIGEFKSGLYYLSKKRPDLELVPVHIDNMNRVLPRGEFLPVPLLSCISFGPPMWLESGEPKTEFLKRAREAVRRLKDL